MRKVGEKNLDVLKVSPTKKMQERRQVYQDKEVENERGSIKHSTGT